MKNSILLALALAVVSLALYGRTVTYDLVWDDPFLIDRLEKLVSSGGPQEIFTSDFRMRDPLGYYRPVTNLSLYIDGKVFGGSSSGYHLTNVLLNAAATVALFLFLFGASSSLPAAFFAALLFALHPVHVESVAFVSGRTDLLAGLFVFLTSAAWAFSRRQGPGRIALTAAGCLCFLCALLSKETALMLPPALLGLAFVVKDPGQARTGWVWRREIPWVAGLSAALLLYGALRLVVAGVGLGAKGLGSGDSGAVGGQLQPAVFKLLAYVKLMMFPVGLSAWYTKEQIVPSLLSFAALAAVTALLLWVARQYSAQWPLWAAGWFLLFLFPSLVVSRGTVVADRYLYLPSASLCFLAGLALAGLMQRGRKRHAAALAGAAALLFVFQSAARTPVWKSDLALFSNIVTVSPGSVQAHGNLGYLLHKDGRPEEAVAEYRKALSLNSNLPRTYFDLGEAYFSLGQWARAAESFAMAARFPRSRAIDYRQLYRRWGAASARMERWDEAAAAYERALRVNPGAADLHAALGQALARLGRTGEARKELLQALRIDPRHRKARQELELLAR